MVDRNISDKLISHLENYINDLECVKISYGNYLRDIKTQRFVERTLQIAIETCIDLANHIVADEKLGAANSNRELFQLLFMHQIISSSTHSHFHNKIIGFRNILVHGYTRLNPEIVFGTLKKIGHFKQFKNEIMKYLSTR